MMFRVLLPVSALVLAAPVQASPIGDPLRFFEGRTESEGTIKILMKKPYRSSSTGRGKIESDGTLVLVQQVRDGSEGTKERRWRIRKVAPNRFVGTMSEASGPITVDQIGNRFRFRFKLKGGLSAEQWVTPLANGLSAASRLTVRKLGMTVATSEGMIRKVVDR